MLHIVCGLKATHDLGSLGSHAFIHLPMRAPLQSFGRAALRHCSSKLMVSPYTEGGQTAGRLERRLGLWLRGSKGIQTSQAAKDMGTCFFVGEGGLARDCVSSIVGSNHAGLPWFGA